MILSATLSKPFSPISALTLLVCLIPALGANLRQTDLVGTSSIAHDISADSLIVPRRNNGRPTVSVKDVRDRHLIARALTSFQNFTNDRDAWLSAQSEIVAPDWVEAFESITSDTSFVGSTPVAVGSNGQENFSLQADNVGENTNFIGMECYKGPLEWDRDYFVGGGKCIYFMVKKNIGAKMSFPVGREITALHFDVARVSDGRDTTMEIVMPSGTLVISIPPLPEDDNQSFGFVLHEGGPISEIIFRCADCNNPTKADLFYMNNIQGVLAPPPPPSVSQPTAVPSSNPTASPSDQPTPSPSAPPSAMPSTAPSSNPTASPSGQPSVSPSSQPSVSPSREPSTAPSNSPSASPSDQPSVAPSSQPSTSPSNQPSSSPSVQPSASPSTAPSSQPSSAPSLSPSDQPSQSPSSTPSSAPTRICQNPSIHKKCESICGHLEKHDCFLDDPLDTTTNGFLRGPCSGLLQAAQNHGCVPAP